MDAEPDAELLTRVKRQLRERMRALRQAVPASAIADRSQRIVERVLALPDWRAAGAVALFWPMQGKHEVDLTRADAAARAEGKRVYYPFMDPSAAGYRTGFRLTPDPTTLVQRGRGFREPPASEPEATRGQLELILVPALAVASNGVRLGYGAGFYDATLPDLCPPARAVAVAFDFQLLAELPREEHDFTCDLVVTDSRSIAVERG